MCRLSAVAKSSTHTPRLSMASPENPPDHRATPSAHNEDAKLCEQSRDSFAVRYLLAVFPLDSGGLFGRVGSYLGKIFRVSSCYYWKPCGLGHAQDL